MDTDKLVGQKSSKRSYAIAALITVVAAVFLIAVCIHMDSGDAKVADAGVADAKVLSSGRVVDASTNKPLAGAIVTLDANETAQTDENGLFQIKPTIKKVAARAYGYTRAEVELASQQGKSPVEIKLKPFLPKALYLTVYGIGDRKIRTAALKLVDETEINSLVIDVKGDKGIIPL